MGKVLLFLAVGSSSGGSGARRVRPEAAPTIPKPAELMVVCAHCGVNQPRSECIEKRRATLLLGRPSPGRRAGRGAGVTESAVGADAVLETQWRSLRYLNLYRFLLASLLFLAPAGLFVRLRLSCTNIRACTYRSRRSIFSRQCWR